jgi:four helix bundle protein
MDCGIRVANFGVNTTRQTINQRLGTDMDKSELKQRTKQFALRTIKLVEALPNGQPAQILGRQLLRSGTSIGSNYRAACRARSSADFIAKMGIVEEEADETLYWMELLVESGITETSEVNFLMREATELLAMTVASIKTAKRRVKQC